MIQKSGLITIETGIGDNSDENDDWDSLDDEEEILLGLNPYNWRYRW